MNFGLILGEKFLLFSPQILLPLARNLRFKCQINYSNSFTFKNIFFFGKQLFGAICFLMSSCPKKQLVIFLLFHLEC